MLLRFHIIYCEPPSPSVWLCCRLPSVVSYQLYHWAIISLPTQHTSTAPALLQPSLRYRHLYGRSREIILLKWRGLGRDISANFSLFLDESINLNANTWWTDGWIILFDWAKKRKQVKTPRCISLHRILNSWLFQIYFTFSGRSLNFTFCYIEKVKWTITWSKSSRQLFPTIQRRRGVQLYLFSTSLLRVTIISFTRRPWYILFWSSFLIICLEWLWLVITLFLH